MLQLEELHNVYTLLAAPRVLAPNGKGKVIFLRVRKRYWALEFFLTWRSRLQLSSLVMRVCCIFHTSTRLGVPKEINLRE